MKGLVSIIVPSYNHSRFVTTLIDSIYAQTYKKFELIVLDDGSKDDSVDIIQKLSLKYGFKFIKKENEGLCKTLNRGLELAQGEFVAIIASDDFIPPNRLEEQVGFMDAHPDIDVLAGSTTLIDNDGIIHGHNSPAVKGLISFEDMLKINRILTATAFVRNSIYKKVGLYNPEHVFEDYHMWLKVLQSGGKIFNTDKMWAYYRISNSDLEKKFNWYYKGAVQALSEFKPNPLVDKYLKRHRLIFVSKLVLLLGDQVFSKYNEIISELSFFEETFIRIISFVPRSLRNHVMLFLKLKV